MEYQYVSPAEKGFEKVKISRKKFKALFPYEKINIFNKVDCWVNHDTKEVVLEQYTNRLGQVVAILLIPLFIICYGVLETKESVGELFRQKEKGHYGYTWIPNKKYYFEIIEK